MKSFIKANESFICDHCGKTVEPHPSSSRDHCNFCLWSKHVDINPGDRMNSCKGMLKPVGLRRKNGKDQIEYKCEKCGQVRYCQVAPDDQLSVLFVG